MASEKLADVHTGSGGMVTREIPRRNYYIRSFFHLVLWWPSMMINIITVISTKLASMLHWGLLPVLQYTH